MRILKYLILIAITSCTANHRIDCDKSQKTIVNHKIFEELEYQIWRARSHKRITHQIYQIFFIKQNIEYSDYVLTYAGNYLDFNAIKPDGYFLLGSEYVFIYNGESDIFIKDTSIIPKSKVLATKKLYKDKKEEIEHLLVGDDIYSNYYRVNHKDNITIKIDTFYDVHNRICLPTAGIIQGRKRN
jgi:hypothetical protein